MIACLGRARPYRHACRPSGPTLLHRAFAVSSALLLHMECCVAHKQYLKRDRFVVHSYSVSHEYRAIAADIGRQERSAVELSNEASTLAPNAFGRFIRY